MKRATSPLPRVVVQRSHAPSTADQLFGLLVLVNAKLDVLLTRQRPANDDALMQRLLPAIVGRYGAQVFTSREVVKDVVFKTIIGGLNSRKLGKLFARNTDVLFSGYCLEKGKTIDGSRVWSVYKPLPVLSSNTAKSDN